MPAAAPPPAEVIAYPTGVEGIGQERRTRSQARLMVLQLPFTWVAG
jgi:hypothetical protein